MALPKGAAAGPTAPAERIWEGPGAGRDAPRAVLYLDLTCAGCASLWLRLRELPLRLSLRHFPAAEESSRAPALHAAAEAAGMQGRFCEMWDSLLADRAHTDDPHLWRRAERLGLDLTRFNADRRSAPVAERVRADHEQGLRAGVESVPAAFTNGAQIQGDLERALRSM